MNLPVLEMPANGSILQNLGVALLALLISQGAATPLKALESSGLFPFVLRLGVFGGRLVAAMAFVATFFLLLPESLLPAVPWVLVAAGVALGWSARDLLRDLLAASVLLLERRIRPGVRLKTEDQAGVVTRMGFRAVFIASDSGGELGLPNRIFLSRSYALDDDPHLPMEIKLRIQSAQSTDQIRDALVEMALFSPFIAPGHRPEAVRDPENAAIWLLKCRLLSSDFVKAFEGALEEQIEASLEKAH
jgi:small-conductance mechanosensitive channel